MLFDNYNGLKSKKIPMNIPFQLALIIRGGGSHIKMISNGIQGIFPWNHAKFGSFFGLLDVNGGM